MAFVRRPAERSLPITRLNPSTVRRAQRLASRLPPRWDRRMRELGKVATNYRGARTTGLRALLFPVLGRWSRLLAVPYGDGMMLVDARDGEIGRMVFIRGEYERLYMEAAVDYLKASPAYCELGPVFVDVGANIGISTLDALLHFGFKEAVCFEPDSRNFRLLRLNLVYNDLDERTTTHRIALSDSDGEGVVERAGTNFGDTRLLSGPSGAGAADREAVTTRRLDSFVEVGELDPSRVGLLWIDAQGHDPFVLAGARKTLEAGVPVVVEYRPKGLTASGGFDLFETLVTENYSSVVDLRRLVDGAEGGGLFDAKAISSLRSLYEGAEFTDLLLLR